MNRRKLFQSAAAICTGFALQAFGKLPPSWTTKKKSIRWADVASQGVEWEGRVVWKNPTPFHGGIDYQFYPKTNFERWEPYVIPDTVKFTGHNWPPILKSLTKNS